jgi:hypothetical protein
MNCHSAAIGLPRMRVIERNQWSVNVEICRDHEGGWILQIEDGRGNATVWTDPFTTEQKAIDAAVKAIDTEGIETFIGPDSEMRFSFDA